MAKLSLRVAEWGRLILPHALDNPGVREKIVRAGDTKLGAAFSERRGIIKARDLVGLINTTDADIQIYPKIYPEDVDESAGLALMKAMISITLSFPHRLSFGVTKASEGPFIELIIKYIAQELLKLLTLQFPRQYYDKTEDLNVIRGRVDLQYQARQMRDKEHHVRVRHSPLQRDNSISQLCKSIAVRLFSVAKTAKTKAIFSEVLSLLEDVTTVPLSVALVDRCHINSLELEWEWIRNIGYLLATNRTTELVKSGEHGGISILFPLDGLFEGLVRSALSRGLYGTEYHLMKEKNIGRLLVQLDNGKELLQLKPDIVISERSSTKPVYIGDVKWKRLKSDLNLINRLDQYQLLTYLTREGLQQGLLFYPSSTPIGLGNRVHPFKVIKNNITIVIIEMDLAQFCHDNDAIRANAESELVKSVIRVY